MHHDPASQAARILEFLQSGEALTPLDALTHFGCMRLGARVWELKRDGHPIIEERVRTPSGKFVSSYRLHVPAVEASTSSGPALPH